MAIRGDRIPDIGTDAETAAYIGPETEVLDLGGQLAIPGFVESHGHFLDVGDATQQLNLMDVESWDEIVGMVEQGCHAHGPASSFGAGAGIRRSGTRHPPARSRDFRPITRSRRSHPRIPSSSATPVDTPRSRMQWQWRWPASRATRAIQMEGRSSATKTETRSARSGRRHRGYWVPAQRNASRPDASRLAGLAAQEVLSKGITTFQDAGSSLGDVDMYRELAETGELGAARKSSIRSLVGRFCTGSAPRPRTTLPQTRASS